MAPNFTMVTFFQKWLRRQPSRNQSDRRGTRYGEGFDEDAGYIPNGPYNSNPTYTYRDNISKIVGKHNLQFGAYFVAAQKNELGSELALERARLLTFDQTSNQQPAMRLRISCWETSPVSANKATSRSITTDTKSSSHISRMTCTSPAV